VQAEMKMVAQFQEYINAPRPSFPTTENPLLVAMGQALAAQARLLEIYITTDVRVMRAHLMLEELGELLIGLGLAVQPDSFDACLDLLYVVIGTGTTYAWPLTDGFKMVHEANMKKTVSDPRIRNKGSYWQPPDVASLLDEKQGKLF